MGVLETSVILASCSLFLYLFFIFIKFLRKTWWIPVRIQRKLRSQGVQGPPYRFIHGNTKEIFDMRKQSMSKPMDLSHGIFPRIMPHIYSFNNIYGKNYLNWYGTRAQLVVSEAELAKEILNNREKTFPKLNPEGFLLKQLGYGLVTSEGEKWAKQRKLANHAFRAESLKGMIPAMVASVEMMLERWKQHEGEGEEIEVFQEFRLLTSEVISRTAFGSSYMEGKDIFEMLIKLSTLLSKNLYKIRIPGLSIFLGNAEDMESEKLERGIRDSILRIKKKREEATNDEEDSLGDDLLGFLLKANRDPDEKNRITIDDVVDECKTFYVAGQETTTTMLAWTVLLLAIHTEWQEKARQEVFQLFRHQNPNPEGISRMKTMNMIINESLRLYTPVVSFTRKVNREVNLGKLILPANVELVIPMLALHHDPQIWGEDASLFNPERFSEGVAKATNNNPGVYIPFGFGPRNCVGLNFATNEAKIALSMILQRYEFTLSPTYIHSPVHMLTVRPQHGVQVILHPLG